MTPTVTADNPFTKMQREYYEKESEKWRPDNRDPVVGSWDAHNNHADYDLLFDKLNTQKMMVLDFGCGPGRMMAKYSNRFGLVDGADIDVRNLVHAGLWVRKECPGRNPRFYGVDGVSLTGVPTGYYDLVYSAICLQHIPVHSIRMNLFREFFRVLNTGGWFTAQMGYGETDDPRGVPYHDDAYNATGTNGYCDVNVTDPKQLETDLTMAGFGMFQHVIRPTGPGDWHPNWIFFRGRKP